MANRPILIIEDDPVIRESLKDFLEIEGFQVESAENGKQGLKKVSEIVRPCLIFLDLFMPQMSGLEFLKRFNKKEVPVVLCTACPTDHQEFQEAKSYAQDAVTKPIDIDKVLNLARKYACG